MTQSTPAPITDLLHKEVASHLELGNYRLVVLEVAILFETYSNGILRPYLKSRGLPAKRIHMLLHQNNGRPHEIAQIAKVILREQTGYAFNKTNQCKNWKEKTVGLRNAVVHGGRFDVKEAEAHTAYDSAHAAAEAINKSLGEGVAVQ